LGEDRVALIKQVKEANDIVDVVGGYVNLRPAGQTFKGRCPFHDDNRPSFDVDPRRQRYRCWSCGKHGDVIQFIQEHDRVDFREALELLARRAGITLEKTADSRQTRGRSVMLEQVKWAAEQFQRCLLDSPLAEAARRYLGERQLTGETIRRFGMGYAPVSGEWLVQLAGQAGMAFETLEKVGLVAARDEGRGYYDRFRDRVMFPIRDARGQTVGFGGRILPSSPLSARGPKYYNSSETPLFSKSEQLYGIDLARQASAKAGYLAVVEGYTDVLMAHQRGVPQVVATMGTALNTKHVRQLRRFVPRVVLVFDADAGGNTGVDRALEIFASEDVDLAVAALPEGLDPCDLLVQQGPEPFNAALANAVDALEFKLNQVLATEAVASIEGRRRAVDEVLRIIALAPEMPGQAGAVKQELIVTRIAQRLALKEETIWARLRELRAARPRDQREPLTREGERKAEEDKPRTPAPLERQLLEVLLAEPELVAEAAAEVSPDEIEHPRARRLLHELYLLRAEGHPPNLDQLRDRINDSDLTAVALKLQEKGRMIHDRTVWLQALLAEFRKRRQHADKLELQNQLQAVRDSTAALELLRQLQNQ
jgi:DNA primase